MFKPIADPSLKTTFDNLSKRPQFIGYVSELAGCKARITIHDGLWHAKGSITEANYPDIDIYINNPDDAQLAKVKYCLPTTSLETSLAHELGHAYFEYLLWEKKGSRILAGRPPSVDETKWRTSMSETMARRFENLTRPFDQQAAIIDTGRSCQTVNEILTKDQVLKHPLR